MESRLQLEMLPQPCDTTCGPTCLHAVYRYYEDLLPLEQVIAESQQLAEGGTLAVLLGCHALRRGYEATIYTFNLQVFDPTWFAAGAPPLAERLQTQMEVKTNPKLHIESEAYIEFLERGGRIRMQDLTSDLICRYLSRSIPILTGLSATYLYQSSREYGMRCEHDDIRGLPAGHFVVLSGYDRTKRTVRVTDPLMPNPMAPQHEYELGLDRVKCAILLGILTYDANLLIIQPKRKPKGSSRADSDRGQ